jgi:hypothetical protein
MRQSTLVLETRRRKPHHAIHRRRTAGTQAEPECTGPGGPRMPAMTTRVPAMAVGSGVTAAARLGYATAPIAMYLVVVDPTTQAEIASVAGAHQELGPGYDEALAEGLVERIGAEIDKRVDARLAQLGPLRPTGPTASTALIPQAAPTAPATRPAWVPVAVAGVSMGCGVAASAIVVFATATNINGTVHNAVNGSQLLLVALIWAVVAVVNVAYARRR